VLTSAARRPLLRSTLARRQPRIRRGRRQPKLLDAHVDARAPLSRRPHADWGHDVDPRRHLGKPGPKLRPRRCNRHRGGRYVDLLGVQRRIDAPGDAWGLAGARLGARVRHCSTLRALSRAGKTILRIGWAYYGSPRRTDHCRGDSSFRQMRTHPPAAAGPRGPSSTSTETGAGRLSLTTGRMWSRRASSLKGWFVWDAADLDRDGRGRAARVQGVARICRAVELRRSDLDRDAVSARSHRDGVARAASPSERAFHAHHRREHPWRTRGTRSEVWSCSLRAVAGACRG
jgi:hypothetical protein